MVDRHRPAPVVRAAPSPARSGPPDSPVSRLAVDPPPPAASQPVHVAFRSAETGRYVFHGMWPAASVARMDMAAAVLGISTEELIHRAIEEYAPDRPDVR